METEGKGRYETAEFRELNPVCKKAMYLGNSIYVALVAVLVVPSVYLAWATEYRLAVLIPCALLMAVVLTYALAAPRIMFAFYRYRMDDDCIEVRRGVIFRSHSLVPVERVHQVQVRKGPILRRYGLAKVIITTAGGTAVMEYLDEDIAEYIADHLNDKIIRMLKARE